MQPPAGDRGDHLEALIPTRVRRCRRLSESVYELELERPPSFRFTPGQSIVVFVGREGRSYSIASAVSAETLFLLIRRIEGGAVSPALCAAAPGTPLQMAGPYGLFGFAASGRPAVFAATGVGIAPFLSILRSGLAGGGREVTLLHGVRESRELFFREELQGAVRAYAACLSREAAPGCCTGRVTAWSRDRLPPGRFDFYLCGSRHMVRDMTRLVDERFPGSLVYTEIFF